MTYRHINIRTCTVKVVVWLDPPKVVGKPFVSHQWSFLVAAEGSYGGPLHWVDCYKHLMWR